MRAGEGRAQVNGQSLTFESPSAFSIYLKRLINPARKADDGWKTVKYGGKFLEHYKLALARRRFGCAPCPQYRVSLPRLFCCFQSQASFEWQQP